MTNVHIRLSNGYIISMCSTRNPSLLDVAVFNDDNGDDWHSMERFTGNPLSTEARVGINGLVEIIHYANSLDASTGKPKQ